MATTFKTFLNQDITTNKTLLHEAIPITGAILSGTYTTGKVNPGAGSTTVPATEHNIKNYTHGMFQSVYDYPYLSSSANHILDISVAYSTGSALSGSITSQAATSGTPDYGSVAIAGNGIDKTDPDTHFKFTCTISNYGALQDGTSKFTILTPKGTTITATSNNGTTTNVAITGDGPGLTATFDSDTDAATTGGHLATCLNAHAELLAVHKGAGVVEVEFLSRGASDDGDKMLGAMTQQDKKIAMYNQMAQVLMGHDTKGKIRRFDNDGLINETEQDATNKMDEVIFINFSRLLVKDEIKKGSFNIQFGTEQRIKTADLATADGNAHILTIKDTNAQNDFRINSPAGEFGILSASHTAHAGNQSMAGPSAGNVGLIFYQAGVCVLTASIFNSVNSGGILNQPVSMSHFGLHGEGKGHAYPSWKHTRNIDQVLTGSKIENICNNIRRRIKQISFNNTTELNSTIYFCRANHNEFNYSSNPTYLDSSKIRVKSVPSDMPISYVTSVGLYSPDNELMAVAKLSEPLRKDPTNELTLRVRLDY